MDNKENKNNSWDDIFDDDEITINRPESLTVDDKLKQRYLDQIKENLNIESILEKLSSEQQAIDKLEEYSNKENMDTSTYLQKLIDNVLNKINELDYDSLEKLMTFLKGTLPVFLTESEIDNFYESALLFVNPEKLLNKLDDALSDLELPLLDPSYIEYGQLECIKSDNLEEEFKEEFNLETLDNLKISDLDNKMDVYGLNEGQSLSNFSEMKLLNSTKKVLLFSLNNNENRKIFIAAFKDTNNKFQLVLPYYGNLYDPKTFEVFELSDEDIDYYSMDALNSLNVLLIEKNKPLICINELGEFEGIESEEELKDIKSENGLFKIGSVYASNNTKAKLFKEDYEIKDDLIDIYMKVNYNPKEDEIKGVLSILTNDTFNKTLLATNKELYFDEVSKKVYILGDDFILEEM